MEKLPHPPDTVNEMNRWLLSGLDGVVAMIGALQLPGKAMPDHGTVFASAVAAIRGLVDFRSVAFFELDDDGLDFELAVCDPDDHRDPVNRELEAQVERGNFAFAMDQTGAVVVPAIATDNTTVMFHAIATQHSVLGMFMGVIDGTSAFVPDAAKKLLSVVLGQCASLIEATQLQRELRNHNIQLESLVAERTAELRQSEQEALQASRAKGQFLAVMSHEMRTPLHAIIGMVELALDTELSAEQRYYLDITKASSEALLSLINDVLDMSKIESGHVELDPQLFGLRDLIDGTVAVLGAKAREKGLVVRGDVDHDVPERAVADDGRLRQILVNLLGNAVKFTHEGEVVLRVTTRLPSPGRATVRFAVTDTGIGIPEDKLATIFEAFTQADASTTRKYGGTGLGLSISRQLVDLMGGTLQVESQSGKGTTFHFEIDMEIATGELALSKHPSMGPPRPLRLLVADDDPINQQVAKRTLEKRGHSVRLATSGVEVLVALEEDTFDVLLCDVQMPDMDGLETTRRVRQTEQGTGERLRIIAATAHAMAEDRARCLEAGMDGYVTKPFRRSALFEAIEAPFEVDDQAPTLVPRKAADALPPVVPKAAPIPGDADSDDVPTAPPVPPRPSSAEQPTSEPPLDEALLLDNIDNDADMLETLIGLFETTTPDDLATLKRALDAGDAEAMSRAAHKIKGAVGNFAAESARRCAQQLETLGKAGQLDAATPVYVEFEAELKRVDQALRELLARLR